MTDLEFGLFAVDAPSRTVRGILIPWGEASRVSRAQDGVPAQQPITFRREDITVPRDHSVVGLNRQHDRFDTIGRATKLDPSHEKGLFAEWTIANTDEGDAWLKDHAGLVRLSPELRGITRHADGHATATVAGGALVPEGAFASAGLFALGDVEVAEPNGTVEPDPEEPEEAPEVTETSIVPATAITPASGSTTVVKDKAPDLSKRGLFAAMRSARLTGDRSPLLPFIQEEQQRADGLFALSNITFDGTGGLNNGSQITGPKYLGELWSGKRFERSIIPLLTQQDLTAISQTGWTWNTRPAMAAWTGNKTAVPSNTPTITPATYPAQRFAGGHDLAREYYDFNVTDVIESYVNAMVDSYAMLSDQYALTQLLAGATTFTPGAVGTGQSKGVNAIIDGALAVAGSGNGTFVRAQPAYALVGSAVYRDIMTLTGLGNYVNVETGPDSITVARVGGIPVYLDGRLAAGQVVVGAKEAAIVWELPGVPIRVQLNDLVLGGVDNAFFGYIAAAVVFPGAVQKATLTYS